MPKRSRLLVGPDGQPIVRQNGEYVRGQREDRPRLKGKNGEPIEDSNGWLLPHYRTFTTIFNAIGRTYKYTFDEALKKSTSDALAMRRDTSLMQMLQESQLAVAQLK